MKELLEKWAGLEPERCKYNSDGSHYNEAPHFRLCALDSEGTRDSIDLLDIEWEQASALGLIHIYVQQAIEARRWYYEEESIFFDALGGYVHYAIVEGHKRESVACKTKALLIAYLAAIENSMPKALQTTSEEVQG